MYFRSYNPRNYTIRKSRCFCKANLFFFQVSHVRNVLTFLFVVISLSSFSEKIINDEYLMHECVFFSELIAKNQLTQYIKSSGFTADDGICTYKKNKIYYYLDSNRNQVTLMPISNELIDVSDIFFKKMKQKSNSFEDSNWLRMKLGYNYVFDLDNKTSVFIRSALPIGKKKNIIIKLVIRTTNHR